MKPSKALQDNLFSLGSLRTVVDEVLAQLKAEQVMERIWGHDHTVWKKDPTEISNRLGWLHGPRNMSVKLPEIHALVDAVRSEGYTHALLLGMGGSSLAPELFRLTFGVRDGFLDLAVLDSTDPGAVSACAGRSDPARTLYIVSTKSGGTVETLSFFKFFYNRVADALGKGEAGGHFAAITDHGSYLHELARRLEFRAAFLNDPNVGGRYSAFSFFGLVPAALIGMDVDVLLDRAMTMVCNCEGCNDPIGWNSEGAVLGAAMGGLADLGRDKLTLIISPPILAFGAWVEQLIAESTGKEGKGILPVVDGQPGPPDAYGDDRLFVYMRLRDDGTYDESVKALIEAGQPVIQFNLADTYDIGGELFRWEIASAVAGHVLGVNPFDQPDVDATKVLARGMMDSYKKEGRLPETTQAFEADGIKVYSDAVSDSLKGAMESFLEGAGPGDYVALQAYIHPTGDAEAALREILARIGERLGCAVTIGFGPRFLHSTGQLHKGDAGNGLFIQLTADDPEDVPIPDEAGSADSSVTFGVLKAAQAMGDYQALINAGRRTIRFHMGADVIAGLGKLKEALC